jgi:hypothetical protein
VGARDGRDIAVKALGQCKLPPVVVEGWRQTDAVGAVTFDASGQNVRQIHIARVEGGRFTLAK